MTTDEAITKLEDGLYGDDLEALSVAFAAIPLLFSLARSANALKRSTGWHTNDAKLAMDLLERQNRAMTTLDAPLDALHDYAARYLP